MYAGVDIDSANEVNIGTDTSRPATAEPTHTHTHRAQPRQRADESDYCVPMFPLSQEIQTNHANHKSGVICVYTRYNS